MDPANPEPHGDDPGEWLEAFRWTQRLARRLVRDPGLAADVHQDTWTRAVERFGDVLPGRKWLGGTLRSMAFRARRGSRRRGLHEGRAARSEIVGSTAELIERNEAQRRVAAAVARLPEDQQVVLLMHFQEGLSLAAVARHLGCSKSTAGERVQRGVAALRRELRGEDGGWRACCALAVPFGTGLGALPPAALASLESSGATVATTGALSAHTLIGIAMKKFALVVSLVALVAVGLSTLRGPESDGGGGGNVTIRPEDVGQIAPSFRSVGEPGADVAMATIPVEAAEPRALMAPAVSPGEAFVLVARVVDVDGAPVPGPRIVAEAPELRVEALGALDGTLELRLGALDLARLARNDLRIQIAGAEFQTLWEARIDSDGTSAIAPPVLGIVEDLGTITLRPAGVVLGHARWTTGGPIAGAQIDVLAHAPDDPDAHHVYGGVEPEVITDAEGRFRVPHLEPGFAGLRVRHRESLADAPVAVASVIALRTTGPVYLDATPAAMVTGRVVDPNGAAVEGAYVNGTGNWSVTNTTKTDADGRFRVALREGSPAAVEAYLPGWTQVKPAPDELQGPNEPHGQGELEIVLRRTIPDAAYRVRVVDAETGMRIPFIGVEVLVGGGVAGSHAGPAPALVTQPDDGLPLDYVPGEDALLAGAKGYNTKVISTEPHAETAPHLTLALEPSGGVQGRLLEGGRPVVGARVQLTSVKVHVADPRESLSLGRTLRLPTERPDPKALTGVGSYSPESVLGLDGPPPAFRLVTGNVRHGAVTDEEGHFHLRDVKGPSVGVQVEVKGRSTWGLGTFTLENGALNLGDVELDAAASLSGRLESAWPWKPLEYRVVLFNPRRKIPIASDGSFFASGLPAGPTYFSLERADEEQGAEALLAFEDVPHFHVDLPPGQARSVTVSLDSYAPSYLDLELTIGGAAPLANGRLRVTPIDDPERSFDLWCKVDGTRVTASTRALGPCRLSMGQSSGEGGFVRVQIPGPAFDLRPGGTIRRSVEVPAGRLGLVLPLDHPGLGLADLDLVLEGEGRRVELVGLSPPDRSGEVASVPGMLHTGPVPPGTYRCSLSPGRWLDGPGKDEVLWVFDVTVAAGETTKVILR